MASIVAAVSGQRYCASPMTSSLMKFVPVAARARRAIFTACSAVVAPAVFGSNL